MKKTSILLWIFLFAALISMLASNPAQAHIEDITWLQPYLEKDGNVVYEDGETASLLVPVTNDVAGAENGLNVSAVIISFGWGKNKTLDLSTSIRQIADGGTEVFEVSFEASATETFTSEMAWDYTIYVEYLNATTGPTKIVDTLTRDRNAVGGEYFKVYSTDQAEAWEMKESIIRIRDNRPFNNTDFNSSVAKLAVYKAENETSNGDALYLRGNFTGAKAHYSNALDLYNGAYTTEENLSPTLDDLFVRKIQAEISNMEAQASLTIAYSTTSILLGSAVVLFGIGYIIKQLGTMRKPEPEPAK